MIILFIDVHNRGPSKTSEGLDLLARAATMFKKGEKWSLAGQTYSRISSILEEVLKATQFIVDCLLILQLGADYIEDAATFYGEAGDCYEKTEPKKAIENLQKAIYIYTEKEMFNDVAHRQLRLKKLLSECLKKTAEFAVQQGFYEEAIQIYEQVRIKKII